MQQHLQRQTDPPRQLVATAFVVITLVQMAARCRAKAAIPKGMLLCRPQVTSQSTRPGKARQAPGIRTASCNPRGRSPPRPQYRVLRMRFKCDSPGQTRAGNNKGVQN